MPDTVPGTSIITSLYFHMKTETQRILRFDLEYTFYVDFIVILRPLKGYDCFSGY